MSRLIQHTCVKRVSLAVLAFVLSFSAFPTVLLAAPGDIQRIRPDGTTFECYTTGRTNITKDGRYVMLECSVASPWGLAPYIADRATGAVEPLTHPLANDELRAEDMTPDGRYILFQTRATNLDPRDTDSAPDLYLLDRMTDAIRLVNTNSAEEKADSSSDAASITPDGKFIVFQSSATNLVPNDMSGPISDVFVKNLETGEVRLAAIDSSGTQLPEGSFTPSISADGRYVTYSAFVRVPNRQIHVFVYDSVTGTSEDITAGQNNAGSSLAAGRSISDDGRYIILQSNASNLVADDNNDALDVFIYDQETSTTQLVSSSALGQQGNGESFGYAISGSGRYVTFTSRATNLIPNDSNGEADVFRKDLVTGKVDIASTSSTGEPGNGQSEAAAISWDGRYVAFRSAASNLVTGDTAPTDVFVKELEVPDTTNPTIDYELSPAPNVGGWNSGDVTVTFTCEDTESGIASCTEPVTVSTEGEGQTVTGTAVDNAGNSASVEAVINIDKTAPTTSTPTMSGIVLGILLGSTTNISATVADTLSGVVRAEYYFDTDPGQGNGTAMNLSSSPTTNGTASATANVSGLGGGQHTLYVRFQDDAGNWSAVASRAFLRLF